MQICPQCEQEHFSTENLCSGCEAEEKAQKREFESREKWVEEMSHQKTLNNSDVNQAHRQVKDIEVYGNGDMFKLLSKASSKKEGWMKSTKAMEISQVGCVVQVTTQQGDNVAEAICFVPGVLIHQDKNGGRRLMAIS